MLIDAFTSTALFAAIALCIGALGFVAGLVVGIEEAKRRFRDSVAAKSPRKS